MTALKISFGLVAITFAAVCHAHTKEEIAAALALICDRPEAFFSSEISPNNPNALRVFSESFSKDRLAKLALPDEALAWLPPSGPCGGPGSPLLIAFFASAARDEVMGRNEGIVYRGWQIVLKHYAYLRKTAPDDFPEISALEEMTKKEKSGVLAQEASELERKKDAQSGSRR